jgi:succinyl-diaminopimelate desuccinylase
MTMISPTVQLALELMVRPSVTPNDNGCQLLLSQRLRTLGFKCKTLSFGEGEAQVENLWAIFGDEGPLFTFAGHTDVVPTGPVTDWRHPPFAGIIANGALHGRGAADMKGSLAAMITATENFLAAHPCPKGRIAYLITADEEGPSINGTAKVIEWLQAHDIDIDWCLVGEPSSTNKLGDTIKNGRRGSLGGELTVIGKQGHVAYPHLADNPIHRLVPALTELTKERWDNGNDHFPATSFQISNIKGGTGATNVIPGKTEVIFNFRFSTATTVKNLQERTIAILQKHQLRYQLNWKLGGEPFLTAKGELVEAAQNAIYKIMGYMPKLSTSGGTSDGRFIAPTGSQVVELGPINATIHQVDECISTADLDQLSLIYQHILTQLLT